MKIIQDNTTYKTREEGLKKNKWELSLTTTEGYRVIKVNNINDIYKLIAYIYKNVLTPSMKQPIFVYYNGVHVASYFLNWTYIQVFHILKSKSACKFIKT